MSRPSESGSTSTLSSKRDSGFSDIVGSFPITNGNLRRISLKKTSQIMDQQHPDSETLSSVYRLYPTTGTNGVTRLRAMEDHHHRPGQPSRTSQSFDTAIYNPSHQHQSRLAHTQPEDDVFDLEPSSDSPTTDDFADHFSLPPSRAESRDSFATPLSSNSRSQTPVSASLEHLSTYNDLDHHTEQPSQSRRTSTRDEHYQSRHGILDHQSRLRQPSAEDLYHHNQYPSAPSHSTQGHYNNVRDQSIGRHSIREQPTQNRHNLSIRAQSVQGRSRVEPALRSPYLPSPNRGRQTLATYVPKGFHTTSARTSTTSLRSHASMGLHKVSSSGQIADIDDEDSPGTPDTMTGRPYGAGDHSSAESIFSQETNATSLNTLPPLQSKGPDNSDAQQLEPLLEDDPRSFDLVDPPTADEPDGVYALEKRADLMFSQKHLQRIFDDSKLLMKFTSFLNLHRPQSIPLLIYYLDSLKAIRAIRYANAIAEALEPIEGQNFTKESPKFTNNTALERKASEAFTVLTEEDLPAYIAYVWIQVVSTSIQRRITGTLAPHLREASEGLAETFCLSDPSRKDNPIVFASEEFARTTQYGMTYAIGRNCRFLQGPRTSPQSIRRLAMACQAGKECNEVFVNYRRDGSPFLNLLMMAPLMDNKGELRYYIGAQVDVSGLLKGCNELPALEDLVAQEQDGIQDKAAEGERDEFQELTEMFNGTELDTVRKYGGRMHKEYVDDSDHESLADRRPRMVLKDSAQDTMERDLDRNRDSSIPAAMKEKINGKLDGVYQHYLLVRPAPSLRILFTSPSLRVPGTLQSPFLHRIGGSPRVRSDLAAALAEGRGVTAKIRWLLKADEDGEGDGRPRWIHCTPLLGHSGAVGVWMIVLVEEEGFVATNNSGRRFRQAPPVASVISGKGWEPERPRDSIKRPTTSHTVDLDTARRGGSGSTEQSNGAGSRSASVAPQPRADKTPPREREHEREREREREQDRDSVVGQSVTAPSPDVPRSSLRRGVSGTSGISGVSAVDFEDPPVPPVPAPRSKSRGLFGLGSRNSSQHNNSHVVHHMSKPRGKANSSADAFNLDLK